MKFSWGQAQHIIEHPSPCKCIPPDPTYYVTALLGPTTENTVLQGAEDPHPQAWLHREPLLLDREDLLGCN
jgi:hypothetical protein